MSTTFFDIFKKNFFILFYSLVFKNKTYVRLSVKWEKTERSWVGGVKNWNGSVVFHSGHKLVHLHTNLKIKLPNQNPIKPSKIKHLTNSYYQTPISHPISSNPKKINTFIHLPSQSKTHKQKPLSSYINTKT